MLHRITLLHQYHIYHTLSSSVCPYGHTCTLTLNHDVRLGGPTQSSVEGVHFANVDKVSLQEATEDVERLCPHVLDLGPRQSRLTMGLEVFHLYLHITWEVMHTHTHTGTYV